MTHYKIKQILDNLNTLEEELLALADDVHLGIDPRDNESVKKGYEFLSLYNENIKQFSESAAILEKQIKAHLGINPETEEVIRVGENKSDKERIIKELDKTQAHSLDENFTFKRPFGYVLGDAAVKGLKTWKSLYLSILDVLYELDAGKFQQISTAEAFATSRGNRFFSHHTSDMRIAEKIKGDMYAEINLSANYIINSIKNLLSFFGIPHQELKIYLREDRDAE